MIKSLIQLAARPAVQPLWGGWFGPRDKQPVTRTNGSVSWSDGAGTRLPVGAAYAIVTVLIVISCYVGALSTARDVSWRLGAPHNLWEPALWHCTSGIVVVALLPLAQCGAMVIRFSAGRLAVAGLAVVALTIVYSALHIIGMGLLRELAYRLCGWAYKYAWSEEVPYEMRKDLFAYFAFVVIFWLAEGPGTAKPTQAPEVQAPEAETPEAALNVAGETAPASEMWLRDGRTSILINPHEIISVASAGNYVEYQLTEQRCHLIRATLQAQEARLAPFGIARLHRSRLVNLKRIVALEWRPSGDFEVRLDSGETVSGSRRFKAVVAGVVG